MKTISTYFLAILATHLVYSALGAPDPATTLHESKHLLTNPDPRPSQRDDGSSVFSLKNVGVHYDVSPARVRLSYGTTVVTRPSRTERRSTEAAEAINAEAMRRYRLRWQAHGVPSRGSAPPTLYPPRLQEISEGVR